jgi:hypothetical protein
MPITKLQNLSDFISQRFHVGIDVHKKPWSVTIRSLDIQLEHFFTTSICGGFDKSLVQKVSG